jgi:SAM-dependent methyltransferase
MKNINQKEIWNEEHKTPEVLFQMDSKEASSGVVKFHDWIKSKKTIRINKGLEIGCGKGRNCIWLGNKGFVMTGLDFAENAILEAKKRNKYENVEFYVQDVTKKWLIEDSSLDFGIDCFASTDIDSEEGRKFAVNEFKRVIKKGGYLLVYTLSVDDEFHKKMINKYPNEQKNAFNHPENNKFEKVFDREELKLLYKDFNWIKEVRIEKNAVFHGKGYKCNHFWLILEKK